jgi:DNA-binding response OmpR family regulator
MRILVVEDELMIAMNLESILEDLGHEVLGPARDKKDALRSVDSAKVALVDVRLADGVTGPEIAEILRAQHGVTVVFTTANPEVVLTSKAGVAVLTKPYDNETIAEAVAYAMARHEGRQVAPPQKLTRIPVAL